MLHAGYHLTSWWYLFELLTRDWSDVATLIVSSDLLQFHTLKWYWSSNSRWSLTTRVTELLIFVFTPLCLNIGRFFTPRWCTFRLLEEPLEQAWALGLLASPRVFGRSASPGCKRRFSLGLNEGCDAFLSGFLPSRHFFMSGTSFVIIDVSFCLLFICKALAESEWNRRYQFAVELRPGIMVIR